MMVIAVDGVVMEVTVDGVVLPMTVDGVVMVVTVDLYLDRAMMILTDPGGCQRETVEEMSGRCMRGAGRTGLMEIGEEEVRPAARIIKQGRLENL